MKAAVAYITLACCGIVLISQTRYADVPAVLWDMTKRGSHDILHYISTSMSHNALLTVGIIIGIVSSIFLINRVPYIKSR